MMNEKAGELFENAIMAWRENKAVGTALISHPLNDLVMVLGILQRLYNANPGRTVLIVTEVYSDRQKIIDFITNQEDEENNKEFKKLIEERYIKILTKNYIDKNNLDFKFSVIIFYHVDNISENSQSYKNLISAKWKLVIWNKLPTDNNVTKLIYNASPLLPCFEQAQLDEIRVSTPIEETLIDVSIPEDSEDYKVLQYYNDYITTSLNVFGSFEIMQQCRVGNVALNISAAQICDQIARENGWNEHLDMSDQMSFQIDELYNPGNLKERASETYNKIRLRGQLVSDYKGKLDAILELVQKNRDKKILIISKRGQFASKVTNYINEMVGDIICGDYHDCVEPVIARDDKGNVLRFKSGAKKGEIRYMGDKAQRTLNEKLFNQNKLSILSTSNAPDKSLYALFDVVIITSTLCEPIETFLYRLSNVYFNNKIILYTIYVKNSIEETRLNNKPLSETHTIVNNCENEIKTDNYSDFVIVD